MLTFIVGVLTGAIGAGTSVLYAALGEVISERAGVINLGVEGTMLVGAAVGIAVTAETEMALLGLLGGMVAGGLFHLLFAYLVVTRKANQLASGLTMGFLGIGLSALIGRPYVGQFVVGLPKLPIPYLADLPYLGRLFFRHDLLIYLAVPVAFLLAWLLANTRWGLALRTVGEDRVVAYAAGLRPSLIQYQAIFVGGLLAGLGGVHLALAYTGVWQEQMTAGRGFIAVALVIFAGWNPLRAVWGALLFGGALAFQLQLQARGAPISPFLLDMLPYLLTLGVLLALRKRAGYTMPAGLNTVFEGMQ
ncbi:MAG: ABC transporter permease [Caldilineaceae bacterium]|nr:ABC transporter permease [Caldilineaceae bacterium]